MIGYIVAGLAFVAVLYLILREVFSPKKRQGKKSLPLPASNLPPKANQNAVEHANENAGKKDKEDERGKSTEHRQDVEHSQRDKER